MARRIRLKAGPYRTHILDRVPGDSERVLSDECSYEVEGWEYTGIPGWDGQIRLYHRTDKSFPTGLLPVVRGLLAAHGFDAVVEHVPVSPAPLPETAWAGPALRDYQSAAAMEAVLEGRGILSLATGGGKTLLAARLVVDLGLRAVFLVHTKDLLEQALGVFRGCLGEEMVGQVGAGVVAPGPVTVATVQTLCRATDTEFKSLDDEQWRDETEITQSAGEYLRAAGCVIHDECHRVAAPTVLSVMEAFPNAHHRYGLSASPWRDDGADIVLRGALGEVLVRIDASELYRMGFLVRPTIRMLSVPPLGGLGRKRYDSVYREYIVENPDRNRMVVDAAMGMLQEGRSVLVLVRHIKHGQTLQSMLAQELGHLPVFLSGSDPDFVRTEVLQEMRDQERPLLIATSIADEGLDIPALSGLVLAGSGKSSVKALQRVGRVLRPFQGKKDALVVDFEDNARYLCDHSMERYKIYDTEEEWIIRVGED